MSIFLYLLALVASLYILHIVFHKRIPAREGDVKIKGTIVVLKKRIIDLTDLRASIVDRIYEFFGYGISFQLVSATVGNQRDRSIGKVGEPSYLQGWITKVTSFSAGEAEYTITFNWNEESHGIPGAVIVKNYHRYEFRLKTLTLDGVPGRGTLHFACSSWVYPQHKYSSDRVFFANYAYLPSDTPGPLKAHRENELNLLRGDGTYRRYEEHERVYDYDLYNDLGDPSNPRDVLGGSEAPYPRRARTGQPGVMGDYLPRDEYFLHLKGSDFYAYGFKSTIKRWILSRGGDEFTSLNDVKKLYGKASLWFYFFCCLAQRIPFEFIRETFRTDGEPFFKFPFPKIINNENEKWSTDKEFARQMLAGVNPICLRAAKDDEIRKISHPKSCKMNDCADEYDRRYFILDHSYVTHYQEQIYDATKQEVYASKTLLYLEDDGTLTPEGILLIERESMDGDVFHPAEDRIEGAEWKLAKAFVVVNDSGYHQLISHWLFTHAVIEPFVISTNRQLSVMHPIYKLLNPHFRDTMNINNLARHSLVNAGGIIESTFFQGSFAMKMTSEIYKDWDLMDHALPKDLVRRRVAVMEDNKIRLLIKDYPYAVDGLEIWSAIETWVTKYCSIYYHDDDTAVKNDTELQEWWKEIRDKGHPDVSKDKWVTMQTLTDLTNVCTIIIWLASALHAAVNFGQYAYGGFVPNRPTLNRRLMPKTEDEKRELKENPEGYFLSTITNKSKSLDIMMVLQILSRHTSGEDYLGTHDHDHNWSTGPKANDPFKEFQADLLDVETKITERNKDIKLKNRRGEVNMPYTLLFPNTSGNRVNGLDGMGIPKSISI